MVQIIIKCFTFELFNLLTYMQRVDDWNWCYRCPDRSHALEELVLDFIRTDDRPVGAVVQHLLVWFLWTRGGLKAKLDRFIIRTNFYSLNQTH